MTLSPPRIALALACLLASCGGGGGGGGGSSGAPATSDPLFGDQWHLVNTGQAGGKPGQDARVSGAWQKGLKGAGVRVAVVDDGLEIAHPDLVDNVVPGKSFNYLNGGSDPTGGAHGTCCAGVCAAVGANNIGGRGAAPRAELVGYNLLQVFTSTHQADAMVRDAQANWVSTNSWGPEDDLGIAIPSPKIWQDAINTGVTYGRGGLGLVYVFAGGNGGEPTPSGPIDDSNLDGYANHPFVIAVAAVGDDGKQASYSETGANLLVAAPSMGRADHGITTVDRSGNAGYNSGGSPADYENGDFTKLFNGTSSSAPLAAGVAALVLEANPSLGWRDVRLILAKSARRNHASDADWTPNGAGHWVNHKYGYGVVDATAAVQLAQGWSNVGAYKFSYGPLIKPNAVIPDANPTGIVTWTTLAATGIQQVEFVQVYLDVPNHTYAGDLEVVLTSPTGTHSVLARPHDMPGGTSAYPGWIFSTARHIDEPADGTWTLTVRDLVPTDVGTFKACQLFVAGH